MTLAIATYGAPRINPAAFAKSNPCTVCPARRLSICDAMRAEDLGRLAAVAGQQRLSAGSTFLNEGDDATHFFNITSGAVKVFKLLPNGRRQITGFLFAGDLLGLAFNDAFTYSAETLTDVTLCRFPRRQFQGLVEAFPKVEHRLLAMASNELAAAHEQMVLLGRKNAQERVASFLLGLVRRKERLGEDAETLSLPMTRSDIADFLGLTIETVSRTFTQLRKQGCIELVGATLVKIVDRAALEELSDIAE